VYIEDAVSTLGFFEVLRDLLGKKKKKRKEKFTTSSSPKTNNSTQVCVKKEFA
jgi:hypothetical protein